MSRADSSSAVKAACALVETETQRGTGYLVSWRFLLTCWHVVRESPSGPIRVHLGQRTQEARLVRSDPAHDLALLALDEPVAELAPLPLADEVPQRGAEWESYGFPAAMLRSGILLTGVVQDVHGQDLGERPALVLQSSQVTAGAELQGFSGSPVVSGGRVIGQLRQIVPDRQGGAQYGVLFACAAASLRALVSELPEPAAPASEEAKSAQASRRRDGEPAPLRARRRRVWAIALLLTVLVGAVSVRTFMRHRPDPAASALRLRLDELLMQDGDPATPPACQTQDAHVLTQLVRAAELLSGGGVQTLRAEDRNALAQLQTLAAETADAPLAEVEVLLARAYLAASPNGGTGEAEGSEGSALGAATRAAALCPALALAHKLIGSAEELRNRPLAAAASYRQALALAPGYLAPRFNLGIVSLRLRDGQAALAAFEDVIRRLPDYPGAHLARGQALLLVGNPARAQLDLEQACRLTPERSEVWMLLGQSHLAQRHTSEAVAAFCQAKKLGNAEGQARCPAGVVHGG